LKDAVGGSRGAGCLGYAARQHLGLVVAALQQTAPRQRHGDDDVVARAGPRFRQGTAHQSAQVNAELRPASVLQGVLHAADGAAGVERP
jgi:hypothetical protein